jgi:enoyl-CoA hydratase/carnithine racemase
VNSTAEQSNRIAVEIDGAIAVVILNRPGKLNALDQPMFRELVETGRRLQRANGIRVVILAGAGRAFCAGVDTAALAAMADTEDPSVLLGTPEPMVGPASALAQQAVHVWSQLPMPVIAAIHGVAFGGGLQLAMGADIRIVAPAAKLSVMEVKWGLIPDMTGTQVLPRLVGLDHAKELTFTGRVLSGSEAVEMGLATRAHPDPRSEAQRLAKNIAKKSPDAVRGAKYLLNLAGMGDLADGFAAEQRVVRQLIGSPNQLESVVANREGRAPQYHD